MEDRELLELAARAIGKKDWQPNIRKSIYGKCCDEGIPYWNPILDDADAFRLAVKLGIPVFPLPGENDLDTLKDTRMIIVRAAASIGKDMQ